MAKNTSLAVWCKPKQKAAATEIELHFNYWRIAGESGTNRLRSLGADFIEIGVMVDNPSQIEAIKIFIPMKTDRKSVTDCSKYFQNNNIAQGVFNEVLRSTNPSSKGPRSIDLLRADNTIFARIHSFRTSNSNISDRELSLTQRDAGTMVLIKSSALDDATSLWTRGTPVYFRLRVTINRLEENPLVSSLSTPDRLFQSSYEKVEYLDFRINEARTLPDAIELEMRGEQAAGIKTRLIAFLTAVPVRSEVSISSTPSHKMRLLEHNVWNAYVPSGLPNGMTVYHWKKSNISSASLASKGLMPEDITEFTAFVKLTTRKNSKKILFCYLVVAFLFAIMGNLAANYVQKDIDWWSTDRLGTNVMHNNKTGMQPQDHLGGEK